MKVRNAVQEVIYKCLLFCTCPQKHKLCTGLTKIYFDLVVDFQVSNSCSITARDSLSSGSESIYTSIVLTFRIVASHFVLPKQCYGSRSRLLILWICSDFTFFCIYVRDTRSCRRYKTSLSWTVVDFCKFRLLYCTQVNYVPKGSVFGRICFWDGMLQTTSDFCIKYQLLSSHSRVLNEVSAMSIMFVFDFHLL